MKTILTFFFSIFFFVCFSQSKHALAKAYQNNLNLEFKDESTSPLTKNELKNFKTLPFFEVDTQFVIIAELRLTPNDSVFDLPTTTSRLAKYRRYGVATFSIKDTVYKLSIYESMRLKDIPEYKDYLFLPFKDYTNGFETYGGGRYVEPVKMENNQVLIDFNRAYNPYCVYNSRYSCPIVPEANKIKTRVTAGVKISEVR